MKPAVLILAAGASTRMHSDIPKVLHPLGGERVIDYTIKTAKKLSNDVLIVVSEKVKNEISENIILQTHPLGTGDAALVGLVELEGEHVFIIFGDTPLLKEETLRSMYEYHLENNSCITIAGTKTPSNSDYGIINIDDKNVIESILEARDSLDSHNAIRNGGVMLVKRQIAIELLRQVKFSGKEKYLTSIVEIAYSLNIKTCLFSIDFNETMGINSRQDLHNVESILQERWRKVIEVNNTLLDRENIFFSFDTHLEDTIIHPYVSFGPGVVAKRCTILSHCYISNSNINPGCIVGPFTCIRGSNISESHIGNFVELKESKIIKSKVKHLSYIGNTSIDEGSNIGAGVVVCNYDGKKKHNTHIGKNSFIGSNSSLIAPLNIGSNTIIGAGSVITKDVKDNELAVERGRQRNIECVDLLE